MTPERGPFVAHRVPPLPPPPLQVRALSSDAEHARLFELVVIFAQASLGEYVAFHAAPGNEAYLAALGVDHARSVETMRLLTLSGLAATSHVIAYAAIAAALKVRRAPRFPPSRPSRAATLALTILNSSFAMRMATCG
jgi:hypothetical protein